MPKRRKAWWVTASSKKAGGGWHWGKFFDRPTARKGFRWGGQGWIDSPVSFSRIERMRKGDFVVAYQAGEGVLGFSQLASDGYRSRGSEHFDMFDIGASSAIKLKNAVIFDAIKTLPDARDSFEFVRVKQGTVFDVDIGGFEQLVALAVAFNTHMSARLLKLAY